MNFNKKNRLGDSTKAVYKKAIANGFLLSYITAANLQVIRVPNHTGKPVVFNPKAQKTTLSDAVFCAFVKFCELGYFTIS